MSKLPLSAVGMDGAGGPGSAVVPQVATRKVMVAAKMRRVMLRALCRRTRSLRRSLRQFTREIYICP